MIIYYNVKYIEYTHKGFELDLTQNNIITSTK